MTIGIPRAFEYYKNKVLWTVFFEKLGITTITSPETNRQILKDGLRLAVDESCLPAKIFLGHAAWLQGKCDRILVPRLESFGENEMVCTKLWALRDIVKNTLNTDIIDYNIDGAVGADEYSAYIKLGAELGFSRPQAVSAYKEAKAAQKKADISASFAAGRKFRSRKLKLLIVGHDYNIYDKMIGVPITEYLSKAGAETIAACDFFEVDTESCASSLSSTLYWTYSKKLLASVQNYRRSADGIIILTAFPCGPDSLVNELLALKIKDIPILNIITDEHESETGLRTRLESFLDILHSKCAEARII